MGKNAQRRRGDANQPEVDHFVLDPECWVALRRYLGAQPYDQTAVLVQRLDGLPAVTKGDMSKRAEDAERLRDLECDIGANDVEKPEQEGA